MPPDARRAAIIEATIPLLLQHGPALTSKRVAEAAGVAEGTIFRVFESLADLTVAATLEALSEERVRRDLVSVDLGGDLHAATVAAIDLLDERFRRVWSLIGAIHAQRAESKLGCLKDELHKRGAALDAWLATHFEPYAPELAVSPLGFVALLRAVAHGRTTELTDTHPSTDELANLLLNGARKKDAS